MTPRNSNWYLERMCLPDREDRWEQVRRDPGLVPFLDGLEADVAEPLLSGAFDFARKHGPYPVWLRLGRKGLALPGPSRIRLLWRLANLSWFAADFEQAEEFVTELRTVAEDERLRALAVGMLAELWARRGRQGEAMLLRIQEELPVWSRLGEQREWAVTLGKVATLLVARGQITQAREMLKARQDAFEALGDGRGRAQTLLALADISLLQGALDEAQELLEGEVIPGFAWIGDEREGAVAQGKLAEVWEARGGIEEALRIRQGQLPVFERLGDLRERAVTLGKIAALYQEQGDFQAAMDLRRQELQVYEQRGEERDRAICLGAIADLLFEQGALEEVLRIRREEELPVYRRLGDLRSWAVAQGQVAEVLARQGDFLGALRLRMEEELPVYQRLGLVRDVVVGRTNIALLLRVLGRVEEARAHLEEVLPIAREHGFGEHRKIEEILRGFPQS